MGNDKFVEICKRIVARYFNDHKDKTDSFVLSEDDVYVVWLCKALENNKALLSTVVCDGKYYEITYNGEMCDFYLDVYVKLQNECIHREDVNNG